MKKKKHHVAFSASLAFCSSCIFMSEGGGLKMMLFFHWRSSFRESLLPTPASISLSLFTVNMRATWVWKKTKEAYDSCKLFIYNLNGCQGIIVNSNWWTSQKNCTTGTNAIDLYTILVWIMNLSYLEERKQMILSGKVTNHLWLKNPLISPYISSRGRESTIIMGRNKHVFWIKPRGHLPPSHDSLLNIS